MPMITNSEKETEKFGQDLSAKLKGGEVVLLSGELGAGKTTLIKGLARGLGIKNEMTSPTFTLMNVCPMPAGRNFVHIDTYRLKNAQELIDIGVEDYLGKPNTICVIEWPEKISGLLQNKKTISILLEHLEETKRKITVS
ncbi:MAG: tRNA (adenosine(37)-N6)-threonylcarbamoyltransferase complex ATPase subunit type 1 TsaE [Patescibacteria group bacterium]